MAVTTKQFAAMIKSGRPGRRWSKYLKDLIAKPRPKAAKGKKRGS